MADTPIGIFVTLSAYGNRLHGDERGTVDRWNNSYGQPTLAPSNARAGYERRIQVFPSIVFDERRRFVIESAVREACEFKGWAVVACHCRTNHLHVVVGGATDRVEAMRRLKTRSTMALVAANLVGQGTPVWARGGSGRYLWSESDVELAAVYSLEAQGAPLPGTSVWRDSG